MSEQDNQQFSSANSEIGYKPKRNLSAEEPTGTKEPKKKKDEKKTLHTIRFIIIVVLLAGVLIGVFLRITNKSQGSEEAADAGQTEIARLTNYDMEKNYPIMARDVVKMHCRILKCLYNEELDEDEMKKLNDQQRELYGADLLKENPEATQYSGLQQSVAEFQGANMVFLNYTVLPEDTVLYNSFNGGDYAMVYVSCNIKDRTTKTVDVQYLLQKEDEQWKILGWASVEEEQEEDLIFTTSVE